MAWNVVNIGTGGGGATTNTITVPAGGVPKGAMIVLGVTEGGTGAETPGRAFDSVGNQYQLLTYRYQNNGVASGLGALYYCPATQAALASAQTISYTLGLSGDTCALSAFYATGQLGTNDTVDWSVLRTATGASATPSVASGVATTPGELFVGWLAWDNASTVTQDNLHAPWSTPPNLVNISTNTFNGFGGNFVNSGTTAKTYAPTMGTGQSWAIFIAGFRPAVVAVGDNTLIHPSGDAVRTVARGLVQPKTMVAQLDVGGVSTNNEALASFAVPSLGAPIALTPDQLDILRRDSLGLAQAQQQAGLELPSFLFRTGG
jgi:hypothetical protein